jgi:hypothetical protein
MHLNCMCQIMVFNAINTIVTDIEGSGNIGMDPNDVKTMLSNLYQRLI